MIPAKLFEDFTFPMSSDTLAEDEKQKEILTSVKWKRPKEISSRPLLVNPANPGLPMQGILGNCWLFTTFFFISKRIDDIKRLFGNQCFYKDYKGKFSCTLWNPMTTNWTQVIIDDQLPVVENKLIMGSCTYTNQYWVPLLEKACAKMYGSYKALSAGLASEGFMMLTGGFCLKKQISSHDELSQQSIVQQLQMSICNPNQMSIFVSLNKDSGGLKAHHYYVITSVTNSEVELWNPWCSYDNKRINWLTFLEGSPIFTIATKTLTLFSNTSNSWHDHNLVEKWQAGCNSGGGLDRSSFSNNPQFVVATQDNDCLFYIGLIQEMKREFEKRKELQQAIGIFVWNLNDEPKAKLESSFFATNPPNSSLQPNYQYQSDAAIFGKFQPGMKQLLVVPCTFAADVTCSFILRMHTSKTTTVKQIFKCNKPPL